MLQGSPGRGPAGAVAIEGKNDLTDDPEDPFEVFGVVAVPSVATA